MWSEHYSEQYAEEKLREVVDVDRMGRNGTTVIKDCENDIFTQNSNARCSMMPILSLVQEHDLAGQFNE